MNYKEAKRIALRYLFSFSTLNEDEDADYLEDIAWHHAHEKTRQNIEEEWIERMNDGRILGFCAKPEEKILITRAFKNISKKIIKELNSIDKELDNLNNN